MKFGKLLRDYIEETVPDWKEKYLNYKRLKRALKTLPPLAQNVLNDENDVGAFPQLTETVAAAVATPVDAGTADAKEASLTTAAAKATDATTTTAQLTSREFIDELNDELNSFNDLFIDREEDFVIRLKTLQDKVAAFLFSSSLSAAATPANAVTDADTTHHASGTGNAGAPNVPTRASSRSSTSMRLRSELVDFHGEIVLLLNWSMVNYTALTKLLKKHDKLTGNCLREKYLENALQHPFLSTSNVHDILSQVEVLITNLGESTGARSRGSGFSGPDRSELPRVFTPLYAPAETDEGDAPPAHEEFSDVLKQTCIAIQAWQKIRTPHTDADGASEKECAESAAMAEKQTGVKRGRPVDDARCAASDDDEGVET